MGPLVVCICNKLRSREKGTLKNTSYLSTTHYCNGSTTFSINNNMNSLFLSFNGYNVQSVFYLASIQDLTSPHKRTEAAPLQLTCYLCEYIYIYKQTYLYYTQYSWRDRWMLDIWVRWEKFAAVPNLQVSGFRRKPLATQRYVYHFV